MGDTAPLRKYELDELSVGQRFISETAFVPELPLTAGLVAQSDQWTLHRLESKGSPCSVEFSRWNTAAMTTRLLAKGGLPVMYDVFAFSMELRSLKPTCCGDELAVLSEVLEITPVSSPICRIAAKVRSDTINQRGEVVQSMVFQLITSKGGDVYR